MIQLTNLTGDKIYINIDQALHLEQFPSHSNIYFTRQYSISVKETIDEVMEKANSLKK